MFYFDNQFTYLTVRRKVYLYRTTEVNLWNKGGREILVDEWLTERQSERCSQALATSAGKPAQSRPRQQGWHPDLLIAAI